jgi:hypothetical protein
MASRTERHLEIAEGHIRAHQAMTQAKIEGRTPVCPPSKLKPGCVVFAPQSGERVVQNSIYGPQDPKEGSLKELRMFWARIPDFGIKHFHVFATEEGWGQILHWSGTGEDGELKHAEEASFSWTDPEFNVTRVELYSDSRQWMGVAAYATGSDPATFKAADYFAAVAAA